MENKKELDKTVTLSIKLLNPLDSESVTTIAVSNREKEHLVFNSTLNKFALNKEELELALNDIKTFLETH